MSSLPASAYPSKAAFKRVFDAAKALGIKVVGFRVEPGGAISVWDKETAPPAPIDELAAWRAAKKG